VADALVIVGKPLICPVVEPRAIPGGNAGEIE
jgi:hypothetical protein